MYLDGHGIGDVDDVLRDRRHLADDGVLIVTIGVDMVKGDIVIGPDVDSHGVTDDTASIHDEVAQRVIDVVREFKAPFDPDALRAPRAKCRRQGRAQVP